MKKWEENLPNMTPEQAYYEFEIIHPFRDGNGRTGKIIYNWLMGTLRAPVFPPDMFGGISNP
jgi:fido (protein-threonine AMPylation protein)